jgi:hypothetical protein
VMKRPVPDLPADARQCLWAGSRQEAVCEDAPIRQLDEDEVVAASLPQRVASRNG